MPGSDDDDKPRSGKVRHDSGGRAIWEWAVESGRHAIDSTSRLLKRLDLTGISLVGDDTKPWEKPREGEASAASAAPREESKTAPTFGGPRESDPLAHRGQSFNPYDSRTPVAGMPPRRFRPSRCSG